MAFVRHDPNVGDGVIPVLVQTVASLRVNVWKSPDAYSMHTLMVPSDVVGTQTRAKTRNVPTCDQCAPPPVAWDESIAW